jgi:hypothetical protein
MQSLQNRLLADTNHRRNGATWMMERRERPFRTSQWLFPLLLCMATAGQAGAQSDSRAANTSLPTLSGFDDGWNTLHPAGETTCAHGDDFVFYARGADPTRLMVYLYGGGGCWDAETCDPARSIRARSSTFTYMATIEPDRHPARQSGILDLDHPDNPVADYSMVAVPVCTGDAFLGDRDATYSLETGSGETRQFTIRHRGQTNTMAAIQWIRDNFEAPREIFVAGSSAGGVATPFYSSLLAQHYPRARVVGLGDGAGSWRTEGTRGADPGQWGIPDVVRGHPGWEEFNDTPRIEHLYVTAARTAPNLRLYQFDHAHDNVQRFYLELAGADDPDALPHTRATRRTIRDQVPDFRSFMVGGFEHTVLREPTFYHYQTDGQPLRDWVAAIVAGESVTSVDCEDDCLRPGFVYTEADLVIVDRVLELLSGPDAWNPRDGPGACPAQADRHSLRCAMARAATEVTGWTPRGWANLPGAAWDMVYTAGYRLGDTRRGDVVRLYNNHPDTTAADMVSLLEEVRERVRAGLTGDVGR